MDDTEALHAYRRQTHHALALMTDALHAITDDKPEIAHEFVDRAISHLMSARCTHDDVIASYAD